MIAILAVMLVLRFRMLRKVLVTAMARERHAAILTRLRHSLAVAMAGSAMMLVLRSGIAAV
jgi:hypothetical protein